MLARLLTCLALTAPPAAPPAAPTPPSRPPVAEAEPLRAFRFTDIDFDDAFWQPVLDTNRKVTLPYIWQQCEKTGRFANFRRAAGKEEGPHQGYFFNDSDVYKLIEGASYILEKHHDEALGMKLEALVADVVGAQQPDGYLNTYFTLVEPDKRWTDMPGKHELYCLGHLLEAGIAYWEATGQRPLLDAAKKAVANVRTVFGPGKRTDVCGHPEIELALERLGELTEDPADRALAGWFLMQRGRANGRPSAGEYAQDHKPIREQTEVVGHAVRAMYLYAAAAMLARQSNDAELTKALETLWTDLVERKMYITGGIGSASGNEGFTTAFDLPNDDAYAETCAAIGLVLWAHEMNMLTRDARYANVLERALYNAVRGGVSLSGDRFFYSNPLASRGGAERQPWYDCACCPPNLLRILARLGDFVAFRDADTIYLNMYVKSTFNTSFRRSVRVAQHTDYPWDGKVRMWVNTSRPYTFKLALRVPDWCEGMTIAVNDEPVTPRLERGYAVVEREWTPKDVVEVIMPMPVNVVQANPRVASQEGRFALQRGPLVYCVEGVDSADDLRSLVFDPRQPFAIARRDDLLGGIVTINGTATRTSTSPDGQRRADVPVPFAAIPFYAWNNRGTGPMLVWLPEDPAHADKPRDPTVKVSASHCYASDTIDALNDGEVPAGGSPRFTWWPRKGSSQGGAAVGAPVGASPASAAASAGAADAAEWVQYDFTAPRRIGAATMDWFDDTARGGGCATPASWRLVTKEGAAWREIAKGDVAPGAPRTRAEFPPVEASALRLECTLRAGMSGGLLEWKVE